MTRVGQAVLDELGDPTATLCAACTPRRTLYPEDRYILPLPRGQHHLEHQLRLRRQRAAGQEVLCAAHCLRCWAGDEGWMAEHMLIVGIENPKGEIKYIAAAFPSACGKTNLAMLIPPEIYRNKGYKVWCVGDDIAWLRIGKDGRLWATNPENGFFGVAPGTNAKTNPNALAATRQNTIFTNVVRNLEDNTVWWEGLDKNPPEYGDGLAGQSLERQDRDRPRAHSPTAASPLPLPGCPCISDKSSTTPTACPSRPSSSAAAAPRTAPLVYRELRLEARRLRGLGPGSRETTAAAAGARSAWCAATPWPCCPSAATTWAITLPHWLDMGEKPEHKPKIFHVNWFRQDKDGNFLWPGFGDNMRVLEWILARCEDAVPAVKSPIGLLPRKEDINVQGLDLAPGALDELLTVDNGLWLKEVQGLREFYSKFDRLPDALRAQLDGLEARLKG